MAREEIDQKERGVEVQFPGNDSSITKGRKPSTWVP